MSRNRISRTLSMAASAALVVGLLAAPATAGPPNLNTCPSDWIYGGEFHDVNIPEGAWCTFVGSAILGNVTVGKNARLDLYGAIGGVLYDTSVKGNVTGREGSSIYVNHATIGNDLKQAKGKTAQIGSSVIGNNVTINEDDFTPHKVSVIVDQSSVGNDLKVAGNVGIRVFGNTIGNNCQAKINTGESVDFFDNAISGNAEGQCAP